MNSRVVLQPHKTVRKKKLSLWKGFLVVLFATGLTTLAIHGEEYLPTDAYAFERWWHTEGQ